MKQSYINIITSELPNLSEDQLFKVLVLVKNTVDSKELKKPERSTFDKNVILFDPTLAIKHSFPLPEVENDANKIKKILASRNLVGGYGIIDFNGKSPSSTRKTAVVKYVCFCIPNIFDGMVEIGPCDSLLRCNYILTIKYIGENRKLIFSTFCTEEFSDKLDSIIKTELEKNKKT